MARRGPRPRRPDRLDRVDELVHQVLADELERCADPRLDLVTVTGVQTSGDLGHATVYYAVPVRTDGVDADREAVAAGLRGVAGRLRAALGRQVRLRRTPELHFEEDSGVLQGRRIEAILRDLHANEGRPAGDAEGPGGGT